MDDESLSWGSQSLAGNGDTEVDCCCSPSVVHRSSFALKCDICNKPVLVACLHNQFKQTGGLAPKYTCSIEWLHAFINHSDLKYTCQLCRAAGSKSHDVPTTVISSSSSTVGNSNAPNLSILMKSIDDMNIKLNKLCSSISSVSTTITNTGSSTAINGNETIHHPPSYSDVVTSNIVSSDLVKSVVSQTIKEQHKTTSVKSTLVVYGFPEEGVDYEELIAMFDYLGCRCDISRHIRLGRPVSNGRKNIARPIKVELRSPDMVDSILSQAKYLKQCDYYGSVNVDRWRSSEELQNIKSLRQRCCELNEASDISIKGRKPYVVISGKLMCRGANGKLRNFADPSSSKSPISSAVTNNKLAHSQKTNTTNNQPLNPKN